MINKNSDSRKGAESLALGGVTTSVVSTIEAETETDQVSGKYPRTVLIMLVGNALISFGSSAIAVLIIYMTDRCHYTEDEAAIIFHLFTGLTMMVPVISGTIADACCGKYMVILFGLIFGAFGYVSLTVGSIPKFNYEPRNSVWVCFTCRIIGLGSVSNLVPLQVEQFNLQLQKKYVSQFFEIYLIVNSVALMLSGIIYPILREDCQCYGRDDCYTLNFAISTFLNIVVVVLILAIEPFLSLSKPKGSKLILVTSCVWYALIRRCQKKPENDIHRYHWLDYASDKYSAQLITDIKSIFGIFGVILIIPFTYVSSCQIKSSWIFQARLMNGYIGFMYIKPEQMIVLHTLLSVVLAPVYTYWFLPCVKKIRLHRSLTLAIIGSGFVLIAYFMSAALQILIERLQPAPIQSGFGQIRIINVLDCTFKVTLPNSGVTMISPMQFYANTKIKIKGRDLYTIKLDGDGLECPIYLNKGLNLEVIEEEAVTYVLDKDDIWTYLDIVNKSMKGHPYIRIIASKKIKYKEIKFSTYREFEGLHIPLNDSSLHTISPSMTYIIDIDNVQKKFDIQLEMGAMYNFVINANATMIEQHVLVRPNSIHMMWQTPQIIMMLWGTVITDISVHQFLYSQAPSKLRHISWAYGMMLRCFGNFIIMIIKSIHIQKKSNEYFLVCGIHGVSMGVFWFLLRRYRYKVWE